MKLSELTVNKLPWKKTEVSLSSLDSIKADILLAESSMERVKKAVLVCDELLTNTVMYSKAENAGYFCMKENDSLLLGLYDDGIPFDPVSYNSPEKDPLDLDSGGMGLILTEQTVKEWYYQRSNNKNIILMRF